MTSLRRKLLRFFRPSDEWLLVGLGAFLFFIATNTQTGWLYVVVSFLAALLVVGFVVPRLTLRGLVVTRECASATREGDTVTVRVHVHNPSRWPRFLFAVEETPPGGGSPRRFLVGRLGAGGTATVSYPLPCPRRGAWRLAPVSLYSATPVGLFPHRDAFPAEAEVLVYPVGPTLRRLSLASIADTASGPSTRNRAGQSFDFLGIREYQFGDDRRHVHWPSSARTGRLMVREFQDMAAESLAVLIDVGPAGGAEREGQSPLDQATRMAASLLHYAREAGATAHLLADGDVRRGGRGDEALAWLARLQAAPSRTPSEVVRAGIGLLPRRGHLVVLAMDRGLDGSALGLLAERRIRCTVLVFATASWDGDAALTADGASRVIRFGDALAEPLSFTPPPVSSNGNGNGKREALTA